MAKSKKFELYSKYCELHNQIYALGGLANGYDYEITTDTDRMEWEASRHTVKELEKKVRIAESVLENCKFQQRYNDYINTEDGAKWHAEISEKIENLTDQLISMRGVEYQTLICGYVQDALGDDWFAIVHGPECVEIGLFDKSLGEGKMGFIFGRSFNVYCDHFANFHETVNPDITMSYGTTGRFTLCDDVEKNEYQPQYLAGMAKFANDNVLITKIKNAMDEYYIKYEVVCYERSELQKQLKNPFND